MAHMDIAGSGGISWPFSNSREDISVADGSCLRYLSITGLT